MPISILISFLKQTFEQSPGCLGDLLVVDAFGDVQGCLAVSAGVGCIMELMMELGDLPVSEHQLFLVLGDDHLLGLLEDPYDIVRILYSLEDLPMAFLTTQYYFLFF